MVLTIELDQEDDGRWIAEVVEIPGAVAYGATSDQAKAKAQAVALRAIAGQLEHGETTSELSNVSFAAA
jgi:predicted RNase H-like HicB family nuclease